MGGRFILGRSWSVAALAIVLTLVGAACVSDRPRYHGPWLHQSLFEPPQRSLPERVLLLPAHVLAGTRDTGGEFIEDPGESARLAAVLDRGMVEHLSGFEVVPPPALSDAQRANLVAHVELFDIVARAAIGAGNGGSTPSFKLNEFDYTLGPGLAELGRASGVEVGLMSSMRSGGLLTALVDLASGDLLWLQQGVYSAGQEQSERELLATFERLWMGYPGLTAYAREREES